MFGGLFACAVRVVFSLYVWVILYFLRFTLCGLHTALFMLDVFNILSFVVCIFVFDVRTFNGLHFFARIHSCCTHARVRPTV